MMYKQQMAETIIDMNILYQLPREKLNEQIYDLLQTCQENTLCRPELEKKRRNIHDLDELYLHVEKELSPYTISRHIYTEYIAFSNNLEPVQRSILELVYTQQGHCVNFTSSSSNNENSAEEETSAGQLFTDIQPWLSTTLLILKSQIGALTLILALEITTCSQ